jgi:hypothetical protein
MNETAALRYDMVAAVLGKTDLSDEFKALVEICGSSPQLLKEYGVNNLQFLLHGIEIGQDIKSHLLFAATLIGPRLQGFVECYEGFQPYRGSLPSGISFDDNQDEIRLKLGREPIHCEKEQLPANVAKITGKRLRKWIHSNSKEPNVVDSRNYLIGDTEYTFSCNELDCGRLFRVIIVKTTT